MPHCIIEYSNKLENEIVESIVQDIDNIIETSHLFDRETIKVRALPFSVYLVVDENQPFIHITLKLLTGRTEKMKEELSQELLNSWVREFKNLRNISVDIVELNSNYYKKYKIHDRAKN